MTQQEVDNPDVADPAAPEQVTTPDDPTLVRETRAARPVVPPDHDDAVVLRSSRAIRAERRAAMLDRYGGMYWGSDFIGFAVAIFFTTVFLGIVGAIVGAVGYQLGAPVPKVGGTLSGTTQTLGYGALAGSLVALFLGYFIGGYTAGRMARFDGAKNGVGVVIWTVIVAIVLGIVGGIAGNRFNVASQLHLNLDATTLTIGGVISVLVALIVMLLGAMLGGSAGERYHRAIDRDAESLS